MALRLDVQVGADATGFKRTMSGLAGTANNALGGLKSAIAGAFTIGAITAYSKSVISWASNIRDMADSLGVSVEWLQKMSAGAEQFGASMDDVAKTIGNMTKNRQLAIQTPTSQAAVSFRNLGINQQELTGLSPQAFFDRMIKAVANGTQANMADLENVGGRSARALGAAFRSQFENDAPILSEDMINQLDAMEDASTGVAQLLRVELAPSIIFVGDTVRNVVTAIRAYASGLGALFANLDIDKIKKSALDFKGGSFIGELARQLGDGSVAAEDAFKGVIQAAEDSKVKVDQANLAAREAKRQRNNQPPEFAPLETKASALKSKTYSDALISVGNFLGSGRNKLESIAEKHLAVAKETNENIKKIASGSTPTINVPSL